MLTLDQLPVGQSGQIASVGGRGALRRRLLDMGLTPRTQVRVRKVAPMGDPIELTLRGYELTLRLEDAKNIVIGDPGEVQAQHGPQHDHHPHHGQEHGHHPHHGQEHGGRR